MVRPVIRIAKEQDAVPMLEIYAPFVKETAITFEYDIPTGEEFSKRIKKYLLEYPWLVWEQEEQTIAYAYASKHRDRAAYQWSVESSVYVRPDFQRKGVARSLYRVLFDLLKAQGILNVYAGIAQPNMKSVLLHQSCGFSDVGIYKNVGYKSGAWHDVLWMHKSLGHHPLQPQKPVLFRDFQDTDSCKNIMKSVNETLV